MTDVGAENPSFARDAAMSPYLYEAQNCYGRLLSSLARESGYAQTVGSFDRTWWCWKFTDFSASRFQEGLYALCHMLAHPHIHPHNETHLISLITQGLTRWRHLQHSNGSFDEAYPHEYSLAATAFTCFYIGEGLALIKDHLPQDEYEQNLQALTRGAQWLARNGEYHGVLSNHLAAAAGALHVVHRLSPHSAFAQARDRYLSQIQNHQNPQEGWMLEYGGADPGYQSHGLFYLAQIYITADPATKRRLYDSLRKALSFQKWFLQPDGSFGGEYASRGTCFAFPAAFEILAPDFPDAASIARAMRYMIETQNAIGPADIDRWNLFPMLNNYLFADAASRFNDTEQAEPLFWQGRHDTTKYFEHAGIFIHKTDQTLTILSDLGGTIKQWNTATGALTYSDCGYIVQRGHKVFSSQNRADEISIDAANHIKIKSRFSSLPQTTMSPWRFLVFRGFTLTLGRFPRIAKHVKSLLVKTLIKNKKTCRIMLERDIKLDGKACHISDHITGLQSSDVLEAAAHHVPVHMGSARYVGRRYALLPPIESPKRSQGHQDARRDYTLPPINKTRKDAA